jgi:hypothetical protein
MKAGENFSKKTGGLYPLFEREEEFMVFGVVCLPRVTVVGFQGFLVFYLVHTFSSPV